MMPESEESQPQEAAPITKPRIKRNLSDEQRAIRSERMKKINAERLAKVREEAIEMHEMRKSASEAPKKIAKLAKEKEDLAQSNSRLAKEKEDLATRLESIELEDAEEPESEDEDVRLIKTILAVKRATSEKKPAAKKSAAKKSPPPSPPPEEKPKRQYRKRIAPEEPKQPLTTKRPTSAPPVETSAPRVVCKFL